MKIIKFYTIFLFSIFITLYACRFNQPKRLDSPKIETSAFQGTRTTQKKVAAEAYYYRTLASFVNGTLTSDNINSYEDQSNQVNLVVLYEANAPWAEGLYTELPQTTGNEQLNELLTTNQLKIIKQFSIDSNNKGFVLESSSLLHDPIETARRLSLVEHVLMVNIKEVPPSDMNAASK